MADWVGVDFDGTLCRFTDQLPVPGMVERIKRFREQGVEVRVLTARIASKYPQEHRDQHTNLIKAWCQQYIGEVLPVTSEKDYEMILLYDDRAIAVKTDTGELRGWYETVSAGVSPDT